MTAFERVKRVLIEEMDLDPDEITPEATFRDLGIDSLEFAQLILELEDEFKLEIPDDDTRHILTVGSAAEYAEKRLQ